jgi:hypothetical protein
LGKRRENLEGLWGELASSFTNLGDFLEKLLSLPAICKATDETLYEKTYGNSFRHCGVANVAMAIGGS